MTTRRGGAMLVGVLWALSARVVPLAAQDEPPAAPAAAESSPSGPLAITPEPPQQSEPSEAAESANPAVPGSAAEIGAFEHELEVVTDGSLSTRAVEMPAYWALLGLVKDIPAEELEKSAREVSFHDLMTTPAKFRGELVTVELTVRRVVSYDLPEGNPLGLSKVYEVWGWPTTNEGWLYVAVLTELPERMPSEKDVEIYVRLTGRFFKLQGYQPGGAEPNARPLRAPLILGKLRLVQRPAPPSKAAEWYFGLQLLLVGLMAIGAVRLLILLRVRLARQSRTERFTLADRGAGEAHESPQRDTETDGGAFDWIDEVPKQP
ncbi:MAG: hypothetical protein K1X74_03175 [Pirellulales bacterium]|nr:hypothetical protein [Pirellulales bacterium]